MLNPCIVQGSTKPIKVTQWQTFLAYSMRKLHLTSEAVYLWLPFWQLGGNFCYLYKNACIPQVLKLADTKKPAPWKYGGGEMKVQDEIEGIWTDSHYAPLYFRVRDRQKLQGMWSQGLSKSDAEERSILLFWQRGILHCIFKKILGSFILWARKKKTD